MVQRRAACALPACGGCHFRHDADLVWRQRYCHRRDPAVVLDRASRSNHRNLAWIEALREVGRSKLPGDCPRAVARFRDYAAAMAVEQSWMNGQGSPLNRRTLLAGLGAASLLPSRVLAVPPHRLKLGGLEITVLSDG